VVTECVCASIKRRRKKRRDQDAPPRELKAPDGDKTSSRGGGEEKRVDPPFAAVYPQGVSFFEYFLHPWRSCSSPEFLKFVRRPRLELR